MGKVLIKNLKKKLHSDGHESTNTTVCCGQGRENGNSDKGVLLKALFP